MAAKQHQLEYVINAFVNSNYYKSFAKAEQRMKKASQLSNKLTTGLTLPIIGAGAAAFHFATKMNEGMANVATLIPNSTERVAELKAGIQSLAPEIGKTTEDLTEGAYQVISAFGDTSDAVAILKTNAKAATAGISTTLDAINLTSAVTKAYGDTSAKAVQKASDLALLTVRLGQTTFPELASSIGRVTPLSKALAVSQEELFGVMAAATGVTGGAAEVSTQLRGVLQGLMSPTADMSKLLDKLGYANGEAMVKSLGLQKTIDTIAAHAKASGQPLQKYISSIEGQTLALALSGAQSKDLTDKTQAMYKALGTTDVAFKEQTEGVNAAGFALKQAQVMATVTAQQFGDALAPAVMSVFQAVKPLISKVQSLAKWFNETSPATQKWILAFFALAAAAGPAIRVALGVIKVVAVIKKVVAAMRVLAIASKLMFAGTPIGWIILGLMAVIEVVYLLVKNWDKVKAAIGAVWKWFARFVTEGPGKFIPILGQIGLLIKNWDKVKAVAAAAWSGIVRGVMAAWNWVKTFCTQGMGRFIPIVAVFNAVARHWDQITAGVRKAWDWIKKFLDAAKAVGNWLSKNTLVGGAINAVVKVAGGRAEGGPVSGGRSYVVGENGPEVFTPSRTGFIVPNIRDLMAGAAARPMTGGPQMAAVGAGGMTIGDIHIHVSGNSGDVEAGIKRGTDDLISRLRRLQRDEVRRSFDD